MGWKAAITGHAEKPDIALIRRRLAQQKRLALGAFLAKNTDRNVDDIAGVVGCENMGYFHRIIKDAFGLSPRNFMLQIR